MGILIKGEGCRSEVIKQNILYLFVKNFIEKVRMGEPSCLFNFHQILESRFLHCF